MPLVSIIVPVYKIEEYIEECIKSVLEQSFKDFELILVDDGSPDNCGSICDKYANDDKRIIVLHKNNGGLSSARNAALDYVLVNSESKYISFLDGDDYVDKYFLSKLIDAIHDADISMCYMLRFKGDTFQDKKVYFQGLSNSIDFWAIDGISPNDVVVCNKLFKKELFSNIRFPLGKIHEDEYVIHHIIGINRKINIISDYLYFYRIRESSITSSENGLDKKYISTLIDVNLDRINYYYSLSCTELFFKCLDKAIQLLVEHYHRNCFFLFHQFICVKRKWVLSKKIGRKSKLGEKIFFCLPFLYSLIRG